MDRLVNTEGNKKRIAYTRRHFKEQKYGYKLEFLYLNYLNQDL